MTRGRHHHPRWQPSLNAVSIADGAVLAMGLTFAVASMTAPDGTQPTAAALPTADETPEPVGKGGPRGPVVGPTFAADLPVWTEDDGPVITDGQPLPQVAAITITPVAVQTPPAVVGTPAIDTTPAEPQPTPDVTVPIPTGDGEDAEPVAVTPVETPVETPTPTETPAEPTTETTTTPEEAP